MITTKMMEVHRLTIQRLNSGQNAAQLLFHEDANNAQALREGAAPQHRAMDKTQINSPEPAADIFESSLTLESSHYDEGYADGYRDGFVSGKRDGHEVGEELGFYQGLVDVWLSAIRVDPSCFSTRVQKSIHQITQLLENYPVQDPESDSVDEMKASLRVKLRAVSATLGMKLEYEGYPKTSSIGF